MFTFEQWLNQFDISLREQAIYGRLAEDDYAWYLEQQLSRIPTIQEVKEYGDIITLTTD